MEHPGEGEQPPPPPQPQPWGRLLRLGVEEGEPFVLLRKPEWTVGRRRGEVRGGDGDRPGWGRRTGAGARGGPLGGARRPVPFFRRRGFSQELPFLSRGCAQSLPGAAGRGLHAGDNDERSALVCPVVTGRGGVGKLLGRKSRQGPSDCGSGSCGSETKAKGKLASFPLRAF